MNLLDVLGRFYKRFTPYDAADVFDFGAAIDAVLRRRSPRKASLNNSPSGMRNPYSCERRKALQNITGIRTDRQLPEDLLAGEMRMNLGTAAHDRFREMLAESGLLFGRWKCPSCLLSREAAGTYPADLCPNRVTVATAADSVPGYAAPDTVRVCAEAQAWRRGRGDPVWHYEELRVTDDALGVNGYADGVLVLPDGWYVLEMKTVGFAKFRGARLDKLRANRLIDGAASPLLGAEYLSPTGAPTVSEAHLTQASVYGELLRRAAAAGQLPLPYDRYRGALFVFVCRDSGESRTLRLEETASRYALAMDDVEVRRAVEARADRVVRDDPTAETARVAANFELACTLPGACRDRNDSRAKVCPWQTSCFPYASAAHRAKNAVVYL